MKRAFTLIEVLIGLVLTSIILGILFSSLYETTTIHSRLQKATIAILNRAEFQQRLDEIFSHIEEKAPFFLEEAENNSHILSLTYRCGMDPDPQFCGEVRAHLIFEKGQFSLQIIPNILSDTDKYDPRIETLKTGLKTVQYEFLFKGEALNIWNKGKNTHPSYIKLTLTLDDGLQEVYVFWINHSIEGVFLT